ncbi:tRNA glutamyl-Q(34) synthetase GluQRS [Corynebacterium liangguodongii]|uniref:tRNA glutamyl-Q(34) synthetase GluQRS n=1 Tax=Corynebacterium liangguodongii TaxID=2079535 RepID=A0A2S0WBM8_9CORY|nr:tRNA glutamyl-Q(34) synthetase GluQRS [Corynebacterium liangguodongii]AWB83173.1 tRNA glutamyl-Q(34) synthetase GluQRS [Corynebacterium liangguodongii]PWB98768.1 tRNA glutamyl-Q(34) synthetase GluQRS [Corynebacterium liangguodongii]
MSAGRFAPSPSGDLHVGNLRTAVLAWLFARGSARRFYLRVEDIDSERSTRSAASRQQEDLAAIGIEFDPPVVFQSDRGELYADALGRLPVYECYCTRRDIRNASRAPHARSGLYPGTCRDLDDTQRAYRRHQLAAEGRVPSLRLRAEAAQWRVRDYYRGEVTGPVDDVVLRRGGSINQAQAGDWAYNLAVVVDDGEQGVDQVVRGEDLLFSAPAQAYLAHLLGYPEPVYAHVPLVVTPEGHRLAKRDGAVALREIGSVREVVGWIAESLGCAGVGRLSELLGVFEPERLPLGPCVWERT